MADFSRFLAKEKKTEVEELFSDIQEESRLFEEFLRLHGEKITDVKKIVPQWKEGNIDSLEIIAQEILYQLMPRPRLKFCKIMAQFSY